MIEKLHKRYHDFLTKENLRSFSFGVALIVISLLSEKFANSYVLKLKGVVVDDLFLSNIPAVDVTFLIVQGALLLILLIVILCLYEPKYINFALKVMALFVLTRSFFICLTNLGSYPNLIAFDTNDFGFRIYNYLFNTSNDFFFSGHTGVPYLMALIFWSHKPWRYMFMVISLVFGVAVLLAHIHYSIDVFAAPFITYSIFALSRVFFKKDYQLSRQ